MGVISAIANSDCIRFPFTRSYSMKILPTLSGTMPKNSPVDSSRRIDSQRIRWWM